MTRSEAEFLQLLEKRAKEEEKVVKSGILPRWAAVVGTWMGVNPWRLLIPVSILLYIGIRLVAGEGAREVVLAIFGGFRW